MQSTIVVHLPLDLPREDAVVRRIGIIFIFHNHVHYHGGIHKNTVTQDG
jgi:hypothetical protein